jgi:hypothetical protein
VGKARLRLRDLHDQAPCCSRWKRCGLGYNAGVPARILGALLLSLLASSASTQPPRRVRFAYDPQDSIATCPDEAELRAGVNARLGYDAFDATAGEELKVTLRRSGRELEAVITVTDRQGQLGAERRLVSRQGDCTELASSVELAVSIAIDPFRVAPPPQPVAEPTPLPPPESAPVAPSAPAHLPMTGMVHAGALLAYGSTPATTLGFVLGGSARKGLWSLGLEARADLPRNHALPVGEIRAYALMGSLLPCVHFYGAAACALLTAGAMHAQGRGLDEAQPVTRSYVAAGARLAYALPLSRRFSLLVHGDVTTPITMTALQVDHVGVWTTPRVAASLGIGLGINFP